MSKEDLRPIIEEIVELYWKEGLTLEEVGEEFGHSASWVQKRMNDYDVPRRSTKLNVDFVYAETREEVLDRFDL